jgi:hypothetical protein
MATNSNIILRKIDTFVPVTSPYLLEELKELFKRERGKDWAGRILNYMANLQGIHIIKEDIVPLLNQYSTYVADKEDLPHICTYFASGCAYFVTANRRLTQMKIKVKVNFKSPRDFVEDVLGLEGIDTPEDI